MNEPVILFAKPGAITEDHRRALSDVGVIVVEVDDPNSVKLTRASYEVSHSDLLACAGHALLQHSTAYSAFGTAIATLLTKKGKAK